LMFGLRGGLPLRREAAAGDPRPQVQAGREPNALYRPPHR
jgi:hypothetical protein